MTLDLLKISVILIISLFIYFFTSRYNENKIEYALKHQKFSSNSLGLSIGGYIILLSIFVLNFYLQKLELFFYSCIFLLGVLSDNKIFNSPFYRLCVQIILIFFLVNFSNTEIVSTRIYFFDQILSINYINIIFTTFCILIVINGSNFIDGLNGLVIGYYLLILIILFNSNLDLIFDPETQIIQSLIFVVLVIFILNLFNIIFLGDGGSYLIGVLISIYLINIHVINPYMSPYFVILLLWYPCYENLFSIFRKKFFKQSAIDPDNKHLHQLLFSFFLEKLSKSKLFVNNFTSILINLYNLFIFLIALKYLENTLLLIMLIFINVLIYNSLYFLVKKINTNI
jgi:UDP-N-acetylmuramyl pentapeptide phosphotransferase/UDP-N-acetylglucosamine-1-phosphate transferase|tara:strand:- start:5328 stop:6350 length:1023 start_codon:yes stop_codon:yes gene_type:complete